jgi:hypothetical protein
MANAAAIGRFSSQMLTLLGAQNTVTISNGISVNSFSNNNGSVTLPSPGNLQQANLGLGVIGNYSSSTYDNTRCYFLSRGCSSTLSDTMSALAIDTAAMLGISVQELLEVSDIEGLLSFSPNAYRAFNNLRDPGNQTGTASDIDNSQSIQAGQIRS